MSGRLVPALLLGLAALTAPAAVAQEEEPTKKDIVRESGHICSDLRDAVRPHARKSRRAARKGKLRKSLRHGRRGIRAARPFVRQLDRLDPPYEGNRGAFLRFVHNLDLSLDRLSESYDAIAEGRERRARKRFRRAARRWAFAERAGKKYGLRTSCINLVR